MLYTGRFYTEKVYNEGMKRLIMDQLIHWKESEYRKPLLLMGARQVGKTWLMNEFGKLCYKKVAYVTFFNNSRMKSVFDSDYDIERLLLNINAETHIAVTPGDTLIIFDEIQECPKAVESLKYFCESASEYHVIAAGSLLGVAIHDGISFPVGKVDQMHVYPLSFEEFLLAAGEETLVNVLLEKKYTYLADLKEKYIHWLRNYLYVGGMPEVVSRFLATKDYDTVRQLQNQILEQYRLDFGKRAKNEFKTRIEQVWDSLPGQLSKENKKFFFGQIKKGARMKDFELAIQWLCDAGLVYKVTRVTKPGVPLKAYEEIEAFKLFLLDVGLIGAMCNLNSQTVIEGNRAFVEFKGALTENYVLQQIKANTTYRVFYYATSDATFELDFLLDTEKGPLPIEVKAEENLRAKSFKTYCEKYAPEIAVRTSMANYREESWMTNIPLYAIGTI